MALSSWCSKRTLNIYFYFNDDGVLWRNIYLFVNEIGNLSKDFPELKEKAIENINDVSRYVEDNFGVSISMQKNWANDQINNLFSSGNQFINTIFNATTGTLFKVLIMPVFMFYILFYQDRFSEFILRLAGKRRKNR